MAKKDDYLEALKANKKNTENYYTKSFVKTEQQKLFEKLLSKEKKDFKNIADIACGGGSLSYHLSLLYPDANFTLVEYNNDALDIARERLEGEKFKFNLDSIYEFKTLQENSFDLVACWQTLSWIDNPELALKNLVKITKPGGKIYLSSLFNIDFDVDIYSKVYDNTQESGRSGLGFNYNTYSATTIEKWLKGIAANFEIVPFNPEIDFNYDGRGIGTFTKMVEGKRIQISAGHLLNWAILVITK